MIMKPMASLTGLALAAFFGATIALAPPAQALTSEQSAALAAADQEGSEALARELAAQASLSPADWRDLLDAAITLEPDAAPLLAATLAAVIPVEATEIALEAGGAGNIAVCGAVAGMVPAAAAELSATCGPLDDAYVAALEDIVLLASKLAAGGRQQAAVVEPNTRTTIQNDESELKDHNDLELEDDEVPSPN